MQVPRPIFNLHIWRKMSRYIWISLFPTEILPVSLLCLNQRLFYLCNSGKRNHTRNAIRDMIIVIMSWNWDVCHELFMVISLKDFYFLYRWGGYKLWFLRHFPDEIFSYEASSRDHRHLSLEAGISCWLNNGFDEKDMWDSGRETLNSGFRLSYWQRTKQRRWLSKQPVTTTNNTSLLNCVYRVSQAKAIPTTKILYVHISRQSQFKVISFQNCLIIHQKQRKEKKKRKRQKH